MQTTLSNLLNRIQQSQPTELDDILYTLSRRYAELHPGWEIAILTLPKDDPVERSRILERVLEYEEKQREGH